MAVRNTFQRLVLAVGLFITGLLFGSFELSRFCGRGVEDNRAARRDEEVFALVAVLEELRDLRVDPILLFVVRLCHLFPFLFCECFCLFLFVFLIKSEAR
jgi:hypothetical protein